VAGTQTRPWREVELGAPRLAGLGVAALAVSRVALLGTLRRDGSPRISPVEPYLLEGQLLIGAMAWSQKAADLRHDPRFALHSAITGPDNGEGEFKLYGSAAEAEERTRRAAASAWWSEWPPEKTIVFALQVNRAVYIAWDLERGLMTVDRWSVRSGYSQTTRTYP
jgi:Pyridoxamine 5'-phosphate oxidase